MTAHSISILPELKMQRRSSSIPLSTAEGRAKCPTVLQFCELVICRHAAGQGSR